MTRLSPHFTLDELTFSQHAERHGWDNKPGAPELRNLKALAAMLEDVRRVLGHVPIFISSGYRNPQVNAAIGGADTSQHIQGAAADFTAPGFGPPSVIVDTLAWDSDIPFDQLILEYGKWVHISVAPKPRRMVLQIDRQGTQTIQQGVLA